MYQFISIAVLLGAPFDLSRRIKNALREERRAPLESDGEPLPEPKLWTFQKPNQVSNFFTKHELENDIWASQRAYLDSDAWIDDRQWIDLPRIKSMPSAIPERRDYILGPYDGRYSFHRAD